MIEPIVRLAAAQRGKVLPYRSDKNLNFLRLRLRPGAARKEVDEFTERQSLSALGSGTAAKRN